MAVFFQGTRAAYASHRGAPGHHGKRGHGLGTVMADACDYLGLDCDFAAGLEAAAGSLTRKRRMKFPSVFPTPEEALESLLAGEAVEANGHTARFDDGDMMTWYTNAYGVDGIICGGKPTLEVVTQFLDDMAAGIDYGMTPD